MWGLLHYDLQTAARHCSCCRRWLQRRGPIGSAPRLFGARAECKASPGRPRVTTDCWATYYHLYLQKLVDFPPQLNRLTASEVGFEFLVWTNQWTTRKTTKTTEEMVSECYLQIHIVLKERSLTKRTPGARQGKKFLLQYTDPCKTTKRSDSGLLLIAYWHIFILNKKKDLLRVTFRLFQFLSGAAK